MQDLKKELVKAIGICDFDKVISLLKEGVPNNDMIIHKVINEDKVDLLDYFLFSIEIPNNFLLHYNYPNLGPQPALIYACISRSFNVVNYLLNNDRVSKLIDFSQYTQQAFEYSVIGQDERVVNLLINHEKTKAYIDLDKNIKYIDLAIKRASLLKNYSAIQYLIENVDINTVKRIIALINSNNIYKKELSTIYEKRLIREQVNLYKENPKILKI